MSYVANNTNPLLFEVQTYTYTQTQSRWTAFDKELFGLWLIAMNSFLIAHVPAFVLFDHENLNVESVNSNIVQRLLIGQL